MMESSSIIAAIFFAVAAHYIFNLSYHSKTGIRIIMHNLYMITLLTCR